MKTLSELLLDFKENPTLSKQYAIAIFYLHSENKKEIEPILLNFFKENKGVGDSWWNLFLDANIPFWKDIYLQKVATEVKSVLTLINSRTPGQDQDDIIMLCAGQAYYICTRFSHMPELTAKTYAMYHNTLKNYPLFAIEFDKFKAEKEAFDNEQDDYYASILFI